MKAPKFATMSLDALYGMRNTLEKAIGQQLKAARKGIASLPGLGTAKPKRKTAKKTTAGKKTARKTTARKTSAGKTTRKTAAKPMRAAAKRKTSARVSRKRA